MSDIITKVDEYFLRSKAVIEYPCIVIEDKNVEALPVLMEALEEGDVSVMFEYGGKFNKINKKISRSAYTMKKLLQVYKFTVYLSKDKSIKVRKPVDILEVGTWTL